MREIVLDTETTGLDPKDGHRIVEIGCLELVDRVWSGATYHQYINPERMMDEGAFKVHGISDEMLQDKPVFADIAEDFIRFIGDDPLVIHNAAFDMKFLNWELKAAGHKVLPMDQAIDTLAIARKKFPGSPASLDALCRRFDVDTSSRNLHGALIDSRLLADVYYHLVSATQAGLTFGSSGSDSEGGTVRRIAREPRPHPPLPPAEEEAHRAFLDAAVKEPIWQR
ncbi:MAG: DNA polymerase III subunit epsilon [Minwuia sp.]|nr:DNA polymerase III subunit epsilon [Minwuia sp.]